MTVEKRLERLERQNQILKRGMIGMAAAGLSLLIMGQTLPLKVHDVVRAKRFEAIGDEEQSKVVIGADRNSGWIHVFGKKKVVVSISETDIGDGLIRTLSHKGKELVRISANTDRYGTIRTYGPKGKQLAGMGGSEDGNGIVLINDSAEKLLIAVTTDNNGEGRVVQFNRAGQPKAVWPPSK